jgi:prepilin-type N-terminal cleavage/methylation domain-containing protein
MTKIGRGEKHRAFTLIETLVVISIIGILATTIITSLLGARDKARDVKRKAEISQIGRFLVMSCYAPDAGDGDYDLMPIAQELLNKNPQYSQYLKMIPKDPKSGSDTESGYRYIVSDNGTKCAIYANLENENEPITLSITIPTPKGGTGVFRAANNGPNGTQLYYQYSN